jgi:IgGFc binding protein
MRGIIAACLVTLFIITCGPGGRDHGDCPGICSALGYQACHDGAYGDPMPCGPDQICDPNAGCVVCPPDELYCAGDTGNTVYRCNHDGTGGDPVMDCGADEVCSMGQCKTPCEAAEDNPSNVGCDFWAVDLKNDVSTIGPITTDAMAQQFAIVAANNNDYPVFVTVTMNAARVGEPVDEQVVVMRQVSPGVAEEIDLPQREVDGSMQQNGTYMQRTGSGTFVSPHAYHVVSSGPIVLYQFNPIIVTNAFSNDASTLIPRQALGMQYLVLGFDTANPCGIAGVPIAGIPDHSSITVVPIEDNTTVTVTATHPIKASDGDSGFAIAQTPKGMPLTMHLSRYTVANLMSDQPTNAAPADCQAALHGGQNGDFTGTEIKSDKPILVFTSGERAEGFGGADNIMYPPDWDIDMDHVCCTDHLEEQLLPVTAFGKEFAIARSPIRSTEPNGWVEPDIIRVVATVDGTNITTNLDPPYDHFTLGARQQKTFGATTGFALSSDQPIEVGSFLVPEQFIKQGGIGDPSQITLPAAEQFRKSYVFLVPQSWQDNYMALAKPKDAHIILDGMPLDGAEFSNCYSGAIGTVAGVDYDQITCKLVAGQHTVSADKPFGLSVYGYYAVGSYAFVGGSDVKIINPIE